MKTLVEKHPLSFFMAFTLMYSWSLWALMILSIKGMLPFHFPTSFWGSFGPAIGALTVAGLLNGKEGFKRLLKSAFQFKSTFGNYAFAIVFISAVYVISAVVAGYFNPAVWETKASPDPVEMVLYFFVIAVVGGPLGEEIGWRGFLLPALQKRFNLLVSSLLIALCWLIWHLPLFWLEGAAQSDGSIVFFGLSVLAMSVLFSWIYDRSGGNVWICVLFHTVINYVSAYLIPTMLPVTDADTIFGRTSVALLIVSALTVLALNKDRFLTKTEELTV